MIQQALQFLTNKRRLITEYALLGCVVAIGGLAFSMWISRAELRTELSTAKVELKSQGERMAIAEQAYDTNRKAVEVLQSLRNIDQETFASLQNTLGVIQARNAQVDRKLDQLKAQNDEVKVFFNTRLNRALVCVLEPEQCGKDGLQAN